MDTELFNEKTIKRLSSDVKITQKQRKNADEWIRLLESGSLSKERANYFKFALYVLKDILGYSIREDLDYEKSNIEFTFKDSIGKTILCIEVKGESKDLFGKQTGYRTGQDTPFKQTWDNMGRIDSIKYGICTNYKDFILIDKSKGYSKYHFFDFLSIKNNPDKLKEFIAIFSKERIIDKEFIETLYEKSIIEEREFTKQFYKLFHETRLMLIKELQDNGASRDESIHYAQIFLNRLMFVFFAEDTDKLKPRLFEDMVLNLLKVDSIFSENSHLVCNLIKSIFENLNEGSKRHKIFGFNGGLFKEQIPEKIYFRDFRKKTYFNEIYQHSLLKKEIELDEHSKSIIDLYDGNVNPITLNLLYMASFDFNTEVSVNILGHIFEQSISDLEELKGEKVLRRKKEGVYYTPDFITDYICRNTIVPYLSKKDANTVGDLIDEYTDNISELEKKFKNLKILDPACGSGSFLLKAVEVLLEIHKQIQIVKQIQGEYTAKKVAGLSRKQKRALRDNLQLSFTKWHEEDEAREIIENNIFGVDINEESVDITKLSLFLKIARKNRKLIDLSDNIKCGNSLIDDIEVDAEKAFSWEEEFPFNFDIIIGNPPYVRQERLKGIKPSLEKKYKVYSGVADLYTYFYELGNSLLKPEGILGFISSNKWMKVKYGIGLRRFLKKKQLLRLIDFFELRVFEDASTEPIIVIFRNKEKTNKNLKVSLIDNLKFDDFNQYLQTKTYEINQEELDNSGWNLISDTNTKNILSKISENNITLKEFTHGKMYRGLVTGANDVYVLNKEKYLHLVQESPKSKEIFHEFIEGTEIEKYVIPESDKYLLLTKKGINIDRYPSIKKYLLMYKDRLSKIWEVKYGKQKWYEQRGCKYYDEFFKTKIVYIYTAKEHYFGLDTKNRYLNNNCYFIVSNNRYLLAYLNSNLFKFYKINSFVAFGDAKSKGRCKLDYNKMLNVPIKTINTEYEKNIEILVDEIIKYKNEFNSKKKRFINRLLQNFLLENIPSRLETFYELNFEDLLKEIQKYSSKKLALKDQDEWEDYFNEYKEQLLILKKEIDEIDKNINQIIYKIYGLTREEIDVVEDNLRI